MSHSWQKTRKTSPHTRAFLLKHAATNDIIFANQKALVCAGLNVVMFVLGMGEPFLI